MVWGAVFGVGVLTAVCCWLTGMSVAFTVSGVIALATVAFWWLLLVTYCRIRLPRLVVPLHALAQTIALGIIIAIFQYPAVRMSATLPLADPIMMDFDRHIGVNWMNFLNFVDQRPILHHVFMLSYGLLLLQLLPVILIAGLLDPWRIKRFVVANMIGETLTAAAAIVCPVAGAFITFHPFVLRPGSYPVQFEAVRDGLVSVLHLSRMRGIVQFPSYHTLLAVLVMYAVGRLKWWIRGPVWMLQVLIIGSASPMGGHYIADIAAGAIAAALSIAAACALDAKRPVPKSAGLPKRDTGTRAAVHST